jgi:glutamate synthase (NADPH/NADH) small chain
VLPTPAAAARRRSDPEGDFTLDADMVIMALGFEPEDLPTLFGAPDLNVTRWGTIRADHVTGMTNLPGVFAVGDIVRGASLVVWAIKDGRDVVEHMHRWMTGNQLKEKVGMTHHFPTPEHARLAAKACTIPKPSAMPAASA